MRSIQSRAPRALAYLPLLLVLGALAVPTAGDLVATAAWAQDPPAPQPAPPPAEGGTDIDVTVQHDDGVWYTDPVWLAVGACLLILIVALVVAGSRSSSTTVVK